MYSLQPTSLVKGEEELTPKNANKNWIPMVIQLGFINWSECAQLIELIEHFGQTYFPRWKIFYRAIVDWIIQMFLLKQFQLNCLIHISKF